MLTRFIKAGWFPPAITAAWLIGIFTSTFIVPSQVVLVLLILGGTIWPIVRQEGAPWLFAGFLQDSMGILVYLVNYSGPAQIPAGITLPTIAFLTLVGLAWTLLHNPAKTGRLISIISLLVILFSIAVTAGVLYSWHSLAADKALKYVATCVVSVFAGLVLDKNQRFRLYDFLVAVGLAVSLGIFYNWLTGGLGANWGRFGAFGIDTLGVSVIEGVALLTVWYLPRFRRLRLPFGLVLSAGLLLAASRGPILAVIVTPFILPLLTGTRLRALEFFKRALPLAGIIGLCAVALLLWARIATPSNLVANWGPIRIVNDTNLQDPNIEGRFHRAVVALQDWVTRPIFGWGTAGYTGSVSSRDATALVFPHNIFLEVLAEWGLVGLALFGAILVRCVYNIRLLVRQAKSSGDTHLADESTMIGALLLFTVIRACFSGEIYNNQSLWLAVGLTEALRYESGNIALITQSLRPNHDLTAINDRSES